jgi:hypothetical protein
LIVTRFRQAEIQHFDPGSGNHDVARLEIAVNDVLGMCLDQCGHDLAGIQDCRVQRERAALEPGRQRVALHQFHDQVVGPDVVEGADVRMVQGGYRARLALEPLAELLLCGLDRDGAAQSRVDRAKHVAHAAFAELVFDAVWTQARAGRSSAVASRAA